MNLIGLFSGIGGFELAGEWMGWNIVASCEINPFGQKVLNHYWPKAYHHDDVKTINYEEITKRLDSNRPTILVGGFPCQPYSTAGKRLGKEDDRHLWPYCVKTVRAVRPDWCLFENVRGLTNWNGGMVFDEVQADLEAEGYEVLPFLLPACGVNAPHRRDRIWFIAYSVNNRYKAGRQAETEANRIQGIGGASMVAGEFNGTGLSSNATDTDSSHRCEGWMHQTEREAAKRYTGARDARGYERNTWDNFPTQPPLCSRNDGLSPELAGITFSKHRNESIKAYGNAIVPQVAFQIFKAIEQYQLTGDK